jgi:hypothetical protein
VSASNGDDSRNPEKQLIVVGSETNGTGAAEGKDATAPDGAARAIFSKVVLKTESQADYDSLVISLRNACQPKGALEEILVEKLAAILWRYRRLITAESGEIGENLSSLGRADVRLKEHDRLEAEALRRRESKQGVIGMIYNPGFLSDCLRELRNLRDSIKEYGFSLSSKDRAVLQKLYGMQLQPSGDVYVWKFDRDSLCDVYQLYSSTAAMTEEDRQKNPDLATPQRRRDFVVQAIEKEIQRLTGIENALNKSHPEQMELEQLRRNVPDEDRMERLLRYEASLERAFDRTLAQLERLQEIRLGRPVTRPLNFGIPA